MVKCSEVLQCNDGTSNKVSNIIRMYVRMYVYMYVCVYVCMYVCVCVYMYVYMYYVRVKRTERQLIPLKEHIKWKYRT